MSLHNASVDADYLSDPIVLPSWSFGDRLRKARTMRGLDQRELATLLNVSAGAVAQWETDAARPRDLMTMARRLQEVCRVPAWWLLDIEPVNVADPKPSGGGSATRRNFWFGVGPAGIEPTTSTVEAERFAEIIPIFGRAA